jgi:hypothetical protein
MFRTWIEISRRTALALAIAFLLFSPGFGPACLAAQDPVTVTPVPVKEASPEEIGGATIQNLNPALAQELGFPPNMPGIVVMDVNPSSPAGDSGLLPGDVIMAVNNIPVQTVSQLKDTIWWMGVTPVVFSVVRGGADYIFTFPVW